MATEFSECLTVIVKQSVEQTSSARIVYGAEYLVHDSNNR